jgi:hypothetical protein
MAIDRLVWEFRVWENWKCDSVETLKVLKPKDPKGWGMMMSREGDVDIRIVEVMWLANVT